jgi:hypothetical protein
VPIGTAARFPGGGNMESTRVTTAGRTGCHQRRRARVLTALKGYAESDKRQPAFTAAPPHATVS